jgi:hypothetical protein
MRLPVARIKEAILHPEKLVRQEALHYFADCFSRDAEVMPLAIQAIEKYGRGDAFPYVHGLAQLAQTETTVEWAIRELHRKVDKSDDEERFFPALSRLLCTAEPLLLRPHVDEILKAPGFTKEMAHAFRERLRLATLDADKCWSELERVCAAGVDKNATSQVDYNYADLVVEALAPQGQKYADRILELLGKEVRDFETDPMSYMEIFLVELAGQMRLESAVPLIVQKLHADGEILSEECVDALGKIGTEAAAEAVTEGWLDATWEYRLYAVGALEKIRSDATVRRSLELMPHEKDPLIRTQLADAALGNFADEAIEPIREMVRRRDYDPMHSDLMRKLVTVSTVLDVTFAEFPLWKRESEDRWAKQQRQIKEFEGFAKAPPLPVLPLKSSAAKERDDFPIRKTMPFLRLKKDTGRNDPCPCGSGKKFKKCCIGKAK